MKKFVTLALAGALALALFGCSGGSGTSGTENSTPPDSSTPVESSAPPASTPPESEAPTSITITSLNGNREAAGLEVPYNPQRIAILDMASLDILDALGLGDRVVGSAQTSLDYL